MSLLYFTVRIITFLGSIMTTHVEPQYELPDEDSVLAFTHHHRKEMVGHLYKNNQLPVEPDDRKLLLSTLKDMDASALGRKRIKVEEQANNNQEQAAGMIAQLLQRATLNNNRPFQSDVPMKDIVPPQLGNEVPDPILVEGETDTIAVQGSVEEFMGRMNPDLDIGDIQG